ncbi:hypothetical protein LRC537489_07860 [Mycobacterium riyadhense]
MTIGFAHSDQRAPSVASRNNVAAGALLVLLTSNEYFRPDMPHPRMRMNDTVAYPTAAAAGVRHATEIIPL